MRFSTQVIIAATTKVVVAHASHIVPAKEEKAKRQARARALFRGSSLEADSMATMSMSMPNTVSMMDMDDIINETEDDYKASVKSESEEPDSGVSTLHDHQHWKGLSLESKCDALHHIVSSLPAFKKGKFEYLLKLVCPKEQTTSTSSTSTAATTTTNGCPTLPGTGSGAGLGQGCTAGTDTDCFGCKLYSYCLLFHCLNHLFSICL